jgi:ribosome-binding ATPase YchF (GTP1/OBG family)
MVALGERLLAHLNGGNPAHSLPILEGEEGPLKKFCLLTAKPILYACNVGADDLGKHASNPHVGAVRDYARDHPPARIVEVSVQLEEELAHLSPEEARQFLDGLGVGNGGMEELIRCCYELLDLASFFTAGEKEVRAWTFRRGMKAPACAGIIHGDFEKGFIKAEVVSCGDLEKFGSMGEARAAGRYRLEGKDYEFQDGDVAIFRFN